MRIIGGEYKSRRFSPPKNFPSRPTTDFAKEALFNILENKIDFEDTKVLDLFAGTGNISVEFLSRGSKDVLSIDSNFISFKFMKKTFYDLAEPKWKILKQDVFKFIPKLELKFDLIFADPPFGLKGVEDLPDIIFKNEILIEDGILIIEHGRETNYEEHPNFHEIRKYGGVNFSFFYIK